MKAQLLILNDEGRELVSLTVTNESLMSPDEHDIRQELDRRLIISAIEDALDNPDTSGASSQWYAM